MRRTVRDEEERATFVRAGGSVSRQCPRMRTGASR